MLYSIIKRHNPIKKEIFRYHASAYYSEEINIRTLAKEISKASSLSTADIIAVIESLLEKIPEHLKQSNSVRLDNFGIFKLSFSAKGQENEKDVSSTDINKLRVLFLPSTKFKNALSDVKFTKVKEK